MTAPTAGPAGVPDDGLVVVVKADCPTCRLVEPVVADLAARAGAVVVTQDDPAFPAGLAPLDDRDLDRSLALAIDVVPTLLHRTGGRETARAEGWLRSAWEELSGLDALGPDLTDWQPGCGSRTHDPAVADEVLVRTHGHTLGARRVELSALEDEAEAAHERGWSDGLPVVAPTEARVLRMLAGTRRAPDEVVAVVPPTLTAATVEKVAVNAVLAGCRPEYLPVVLAAVEAACTDEFNAHGLLATTWGAGPAVIVHGPVATRIGMNARGNALGQGRRANSTIGRALQLVIRNVGGGRPGEVDRAALGQPGKVGFCFAEDEEALAADGWTTLGVERGAPGSAVTVFAAEGARGLADQLSRTPASLARSLAVGLRGVCHPKLPGFDATLVLCPEHRAVFTAAGWSRGDLLAALDDLLVLDPAEAARGVGGIAEGLPTRDRPVPKFRPGGLLMACVGGGAGKFSTVIGGWVGGPGGSSPVTRPIEEEP